MATFKQKIAVKKIVENHGTAISRIMVDPEVGYRPATAKNPKNLTESKGFKEEAEPFIKQLEKERNRILKAMSKKDLNYEAYYDLTNALDKTNKNLQLLSGGATENVGVAITGINYIIPKDDGNTEPKADP